MITAVINGFRANVNSNKRVKTSDLVFKLLTRFTVNILIVSVMIISLRQYFGDPIECQQSDGGFKKYIQTKCWIEGVYLERQLLDGKIGKDITRYGVGAKKGGFRAEDHIVQDYYQWIVPVIAIQAILLYMPRIFWQILENDVMAKLVVGADSLISDSNWKPKKVFILEYFRLISKNSHRWYVVKYVGCKLLSFGALAFAMFIMQWVINDFWTTFEPAIDALWDLDMERFKRHSAKLFPTQAKCIYNSYGPSGGMQVLDMLCFLPQNVINEKIFVFLYFWFQAMVLISIFNFFWTFTYFSSTLIKKFGMKWHFDLKNHESYEEFADKYSDFGSFHMLLLLQKNLSPVLFEDLISDLIKQCNMSDLSYLTETDMTHDSNESAGTFQGMSKVQEV